MPLQPIFYEPGITKSQSTYAAGKTVGFASERLAKGRWTNGVNVRFHAGWPEKLGGWTDAAIGVTVKGIARTMKTWTVGLAKYLMVATDSSLYVWIPGGSDAIEVTPLRQLSTTTASWNVTTVLNSHRVVIADTAQTLALGDWLFISMATALNGIQLNGWYQVNQLNLGVNYGVNASVQATGSGTSSISLTYTYPRLTLTNQPLTSTLGSGTVKVHMVGHGAGTGDYVNFSPNPTGFASLTFVSQYQITVIDADNFNISTGQTASATTAGGGNGLTVTFNVHEIGTNGLPVGLQPGWTLSQYGTLMEICQIGGTLYFYDPVAQGTAYPILNAPTGVLASFVTPERFVVALGTSSSPLQIAWSDQQDPTNWTSTASDTANSGRNLQGGSYFVTGIGVSNGVSLILTDKSTFMMQYIGTGEIYATPQLADVAGCCSSWGLVEMGEAAYWRDGTAFWQFNGTVSRLPQDDIQEFIFSNATTTLYGKVILGTNKLKNEIWAWDVSSANTNSNEPDRYAIFQIDSQSWSVPDSGHGVLRTAWTDAAIFALPFAMDTSGRLYQHESGVDDNLVGMECYITSSYADISNGDENAAVTGLLPDFSSISGSLTPTISTKYYPADTPIVDSSLSTITSATQRVDCRDDGKLFSFQLSTQSALGANWRLGAFRIEVTPQSARK